MRSRPLGERLACREPGVEVAPIGSRVSSRSLSRRLGEVRHGGRERRHSADLPVSCGGASQWHPHDRRRRSLVAGVFGLERAGAEPMVVRQSLEERVVG